MSGASILVSGELFRNPERKTSQSGKTYVKATIKMLGADNSAEFWNIMCFSESVADELMELRARRTARGPRRAQGQTVQRQDPKDDLRRIDPAIAAAEEAHTRSTEGNQTATGGDAARGSVPTAVRDEICPSRNQEERGDDGVSWRESFRRSAEATIHPRRRHLRQRRLRRRQDRHVDWRRLGRRRFRRRTGRGGGPVHAEPFGAHQTFAISEPHEVG